LNIKTKLNILPGKNTDAYTKTSDKIRLQRAEIMRSRNKKIRRHELAKKRELLRKKKEIAEGVQYLPNCGINLSSLNLDYNNSNEKLFLNNCSIVYFDLETSGLSANADILQIAAKCEERIFNVYIKPTQPISAGATDITGLYSVAGELFHNNKQIDTVDSKEALQAFKEFLNKNSKPCLLVAHNAPFDAPRLLRSILSHTMLEDFKMITGFSDSLQVFKKVLPKRKGAGKFKLSNLAKDFLQNEDFDEKFHDAEFDVIVLEKLVDAIDVKDLLCKNVKSVHQYLIDFNDSKKINQGLCYLYDLKQILSRDILKKMAKATITVDLLKDEYNTGGEERISLLLSKAQTDKRPLVTKNKKVIEKIVSFLKNLATTK